MKTTAFFINQKLNGFFIVGIVLTAQAEYLEKEIFKITVL